MIYKLGDSLHRPQGPGDPAFALIFLAVLILPRIFYLISMQRAIGRCSPQARAMSPGLVWLGLIPLFYLIWDFVIVVTVSKSVSDEFTARKNPLQGGLPGLGPGIAFCVLNLLFWLPIVNILTILASLVLWIVFWVKISSLSSGLA
ncbi:hypothetical protein GX411_11485 [Candidatus Fermentibacteria bacterium]|nr:hypothetical protein [Candidatus Fermentibacteria bacterium]